MFGDDDVVELVACEDMLDLLDGCVHGGGNNMARHNSINRHASLLDRSSGCIIDRPVWLGRQVVVLGMKERSVGKKSENQPMKPELQHAHLHAPWRLPYLEVLGEKEKADAAGGGGSGTGGGGGVFFERRIGRRPRRIIRIM